jgi:hypothetical protein
VPTGSGSFPNIGSYSVRAVYDGTANYIADTATAVTATVTAPLPTVSLTGATMPLNGNTTLTATVVPPSGGVPTCSNCLQFKVGATLATATTFATVSVTEVSAGSGTYHGQTTISGGSTAFPTIAGSPYTVWAVYAPSGGTGAAGTADDVGGPASSSSATITVTARVVTVTVSANSSVTLGNSITLTATLSPSAAPGTVRFFADGVEVSGASGVTADTTDGTTTFSWSPTTRGDGVATITATYTSSNTTNYASQPTSTSDDVTINAAGTSIVATATQTGGAGSTITFTANITSGFGTQSDIDGGNVTFTVTAGAGTCTGLATVAVTNGVATLTGVTCPAGNNYNVRGTYTGAGDYAGSADTSDFDLDVN